ncbi:MAG TPA: hypothetical protein VE291_02675 [Terracidiphilus sp.]|jgi:membrane protein implicated in regulation of membrane protease activity|nr:hypothetical protein [Terracidiphilus sp.]
MSLDLRIPMGLMFTLAGLILSTFGFATRDDAALYAKSLGINANLWWGLVLFVFGFTMYVLGSRGQQRLEKEPPANELRAKNNGEVRRGR